MKVHGLLMFTFILARTVYSCVLLYFVYALLQTLVDKIMFAHCFSRLFLIITIILKSSSIAARACNNPRGKSEQAHTVQRNATSTKLLEEINSSCVSLSLYATIMPVHTCVIICACVRVSVCVPVYVCILVKPMPSSGPPPIPLDASASGAITKVANLCKLSCNALPVHVLCSGPCPWHQMAWARESASETEHHKRTSFSDRM